MLPGPMRPLAAIALLLAAACGGPQSPEALRNVPPRARLAAPVYAPVGEAVVLDASASFDPDGTVVEYTFLFSDVSQGLAGGRLTLGTPEISHEFTEAGVYEIAVVVRDDAGQLGRATQMVIVRTDPPSCTDASSCALDAQCQFLSGGSGLCYATGSRPGPGVAECVDDRKCGEGSTCRSGLCLGTGVTAPAPTP